MILSIALIPDMHGNLAAFEAVLDALRTESPNEVVCLGHIAATGPQPREVLRRLRGTRYPVLVGNSDAGLLDVPMAVPATDEDIRTVADFLPDGSVRMPRWTEFAILSWSDVGGLSVDFRRVRYDRDATVRAMSERVTPRAAWWAAN